MSQRTRELDAPECASELRRPPKPLACQDETTTPPAQRPRQAEPMHVISFAADRALVDDRMDRVVRDDDAITTGGDTADSGSNRIRWGSTSVDRDADTIRNVATSAKVGEERVHIGRT